MKIKINNHQEDNLFSSLFSVSKELMKIKPDIMSFIETGVMNDKLLKHIKESDVYNFDTMAVFFKARDKYIHDFGFTLINQRLVNSLATSLKGKKVLEVGAGTGFLSHLLKQKNIDITAIDINPTEKNDYNFNQFHTNVLQEDAVDYLTKNGHQFDAVIMSWPDYTSQFAFDVISSLKPNQTLYYCGEGSGGCTADDQFFNCLPEKTKLKSNLTNIINKDFVSWPHIHDRWQVYQII